MAGLVNIVEPFVPRLSMLVVMETVRAVTVFGKGSKTRAVLLSETTWCKLIEPRAGPCTPDGRIAARATWQSR